MPATLGWISMKKLHLKIGTLKLLTPCHSTSFLGIIFSCVPNGPDVMETNLDVDSISSQMNKWVLQYHISYLPQQARKYWPLTASKDTIKSLVDSVALPNYLWHTRIPIECKFLIYDAKVTSFPWQKIIIFKRLREDWLWGGVKETKMNR